MDRCADAEPYRVDALRACTHWYFHLLGGGSGIARFDYRHMRKFCAALIRYARGGQRTVIDKWVGTLYAERSVSRRLALNSAGRPAGRLWNVPRARAGIGAPLFRWFSRRSTPPLELPALTLWNKFCEQQTLRAKDISGAVDPLRAGC